jgi:hypothetical protein
LNDTATQDDIRNLCIEVGRTLMACALVEKHIKQLSRSLVFSEWLDFKANDISLNNAIEGMKKTYTMPKDFVEILHEFRLMRNKFVHEFWDLTRDYTTKDGCAEALSFIVGLYAVASALNKGLYPHVVERLAAVGGWDPTVWSAEILKPATGGSE